MGREIRRVPTGWQHPTCRELQELDAGYDMAWARNYPDNFSPLYDKSYLAACRKWLDDAKAWDAGTHEDLVSETASKDEYPFFWDWANSPPSLSTHRFGKWDFKPEDATCYQVYETVSEGTPVSPVFETRDELRAWLIAQGHSEANADAFIESAWAPSMTFTQTPGQGLSNIKVGIDAAGGD